MVNESRRISVCHDRSSLLCSFVPLRGIDENLPVPEICRLYCVEIKRILSFSALHDDTGMDLVPGNMNVLTYRVLVTKFSYTGPGTTFFVNIRRTSPYVQRCLPDTWSTKVQ